MALAFYRQGAHGASCVYEESRIGAEGSPESSRRQSSETPHSRLHASRHPQPSSLTGDLLNRPPSYRAIAWTMQPSEAATACRSYLGLGQAQLAMQAARSREPLQARRPPGRCADESRHTSYWSGAQRSDVATTRQLMRSKGWRSRTTSLWTQMRVHLRSAVLVYTRIRAAARRTVAPSLPLQSIQSGREQRRQVLSVTNGVEEVSAR